MAGSRAMRDNVRRGSSFPVQVTSAARLVYPKLLTTWCVAANCRDGPTAIMPYNSESAYDAGAFTLLRAQTQSYDSKEGHTIPMRRLAICPSNLRSYLSVGAIEI